MNVRVGTSGYSYAEWKGSFYPEKIAAGEMLGFYASRFPTVEINNTFYRMPKEPLLQGWAGQVPGSFTFVIKASQRITHIKRLKDCGEVLGFLYATTATLGPRLGPILFQLPPNFRKDVPRLRSFFDDMPERRRVAVEFRHASWFDDEVYAALRERNAAWCVAETGEEGDPPFVATADWGYLRLRRVEYSDDDLRSWADRVRSQSWGETFVFFKHEEAGTGPKLAARFMDLCGSREPML